MLEKFAYLKEKITLLKTENPNGLSIFAAKLGRWKRGVENPSFYYPVFWVKRRFQFLI